MNLDYELLRFGNLSTLFSNANKDSHHKGGFFYIVFVLTRFLNFSWIFSQEM